MAFSLRGIRKASLPSIQAFSKAVDVPKGYITVYVGDKMKRFMIPVSYLNQPSFQDLLSQAEEEFGYDHPMGGLTIPCGEDVFLDITSRFNRREDLILYDKQVFIYVSQAAKPSSLDHVRWLCGHNSTSMKHNEGYSWIDEIIRQWNARDHKPLYSSDLKSEVYSISSGLAWDSVLSTITSPITPKETLPRQHHLPSLSYQSHDSYLIALHPQSFK
ncbi:hypothetical protein VNO80_24331 [Phaseolus coccineus]|uniref:Uncharacterized protein n=1 Tax=Phaseolus coccineus TaxID=3886 RepID=A0AAN9QMY8_PHACN